MGERVVMKRKVCVKKWIAGMLAALMIFSLAACGTGSDSAPAPMEAAPAEAGAADAAPEERAADAAPEGPAMEEPEYAPDFSLDEIIEGVFAYMDSEGMAADSNFDDIMDIMELAYLAGEAEDPLSMFTLLCDQGCFVYKNQTEIIMVRAELGSSYRYTIYGVNPDTGEQRTISTFDIPSNVISNADQSRWQNYPMFLPGWRSSVPLRGMFSPDYTYIAVSRYSQDTTQLRAGYYRAGEGLYYTDVTKSTGAVGGDFDEPVKQMAIGFTDDNRFLYADIPAVPGFYYDTADWVFSQVDISGDGSVRSGSQAPFDGADAFLMRGEDWSWWPENCELTDWIDDTHCLINYPEESVGTLGGTRIDRWSVRILDMETQETASFIPGESRSNWSGVISPDGQSVAFLSAVADGNGDAAIYVTSIEGGEPEKLCDSIPSQRGSTGYIITRPESGKTVYFLLEWRRTSP